MIYAEIFIIIIILAYGWSGYRRGFLGQIFDLAGLVISFVITLRFFNFFATMLKQWGLNQNYTKPLGFFTLWVLLQIVFFLLTLLIFRWIPNRIHDNQLNRLLGVAPGLLKGVVIVAIVLMISFISPISPTAKNNLIKDRLTGALIKSSAKAETQMEKIFGNLNSLNFFTTLSPETETTKLNFKTDKFNIDENAENTMFASVNNERAKVGAKPLKIDSTIRTVARFHSMDMAKNGYFSHINLAGKTPADRMRDGSINFLLAGENIALAPNEELAQIGFMNSPKHRDNILDPNFGRIGIGIIDMGVYGLMVTQNFAD